jgi:hypothetical protein
MRHILHIATILLLMIVFVEANAQGKSKIVFDKMEHNFGSMKDSDAAQTTTFKFTNNGSVPLVLTSVRASCGCTTPTWTNTPVAPGSSGEIKVSYDPKNQVGSFSKTVTVTSNAENPNVVLRVNGQVAQREKTLAELYPREVGSLRVKTNHISFASMKDSEVKTEELELLNDTDKPVKVGFRTIPNYITATVQPETIPAKGKGILKVAFNAKELNSFGFTSSRIYLSLDGSNDYKYSVGVSATIEEDFSKLTSEQLSIAPVSVFSEKDYDFGDMRQGEKKEHTFTLKNSGKSELYIRNVRSSCGCTAVAPSTKVISAGQSAPIKVTFDSSGKRGRQSKTITVITNDPKNPTVTLRVSCNILVPES